MKVLVAQHKGGVGKTTLSIHVAGILSSERFSKTLLVDCDTQGDFFRFFSGFYPNEPLELVESPGGQDVIWNPNREKFSNKISFSGYNHIVVDVDTGITNSLQIFAEFAPDLVLVPINVQTLSIEHGRQLCNMLERSMHAFTSKIVIVQMGSSHDTHGAFPDYPAELITYCSDFDKCVSGAGFIWDLDQNLKYFIDEFVRVVNHV